VSRSVDSHGMASKAPHGAASNAPHSGAATGARPDVTVSTPGKLILMGEHAVVYGRPALVAAIDLRLRAIFSSPLAPPGASRPLPEIVETVEIDLPGLGHRVTLAWGEVLAYARAARDGWTAYAARPDLAGFLELRGDDPAHIVKAALGEVAAALGEEAGGEEAGGAPGLCLRLDSELPIGAGFGSSAAAAVAVVAGYAAWRGRDDLDGDTVARLALEAERRQHGLPSGVDTTTSLHGGLLWARRLHASRGGALACERLAADSPLLGRLRVHHTGTPPEATGAVVAAVRTRRDRDPAAYERLFDRMEAATCGLRAELAAAAERPERVTDLIREHQACLEALGVVPAPVRALVRRVEAAGGAAKVSGAGSLAGPGAGSLLVYHADSEAAAAWDFLRPFAHLPVHLGAAGFRRET
jgi:mevalonate kinase